MSERSAEQHAGNHEPRRSGRTPGVPLPTIADVDQVPLAKLPAFVSEATALAAYAAARLQPSATEQDGKDGNAEPDRRVRAPEAAQIIGCSVRWIRQHGSALPSYRRDLNGRRVTWSRNALLAWMQRAGSC
jgi:predicted DNA-binding transcriptional regulator AlpA